MSLTGTARQTNHSNQASPSADAFVHPSAICETDRIGARTRIWAFAHVMSGARIGADCNIGDHAFVESGVTVGDRVTIKNRATVFEGVTIADDVFVGPAVVFTNDRYPRSPRMPEASAKYDPDKDWLEPTIVERGASIGAGAVVVCGVRIGMFATIGSGAVVTRDVASHRLVVGQPAREIGWVCVCGDPLTGSLQCVRCNRSYEQVADRLKARAENHV